MSHVLDWKHVEVISRGLGNRVIRPLAVPNSSGRRVETSALWKVIETTKRGQRGFLRVVLFFQWNMSNRGLVHMFI